MKIMVRQDSGMSKSALDCTALARNDAFVVVCVETQVGVCVCVVDVKIRFGQNDCFENT